VARLPQRAPAREPLERCKRDGRPRHVRPPLRQVRLDSPGRAIPVGTPHKESNRCACLFWPWVPQPSF
jgi:hypothetical protein